MDSFDVDNDASYFRRKEFDNCNLFWNLILILTIVKNLILYEVIVLVCKFVQLHELTKC